MTGSSPVIGRDLLTPEGLAALAAGTPLSVAPEAAGLLDSARAVIDSVLVRDEPAYGVNRGLGPLRDQRIPEELQHDFQRFVFASHDAAVGPLLRREEARAVIIARIAVMARGNSGASRAVFGGLLALIERDVIPALPGEGSVGSADLSLLAAIGRVLVGEGRVLSGDGGETDAAAEALADAGIETIRLAAKDAHSLVVANSGSVGLGSLASVRLDRFAAAADLAATATVQALAANTSVFDDELMRARPHPGQIAAGARIRVLLADGAAERPAGSSLQDPLSVRTIPQVHGTLLEEGARLREVLTVELNAMPENPFIDRERDLMISNGNFSTIRLAVSLESARLAAIHTAMLSERRIALMIAQLRSGRSLVDQIAGFEREALVPSILANTASALAARLQQLAAPVSTLGPGVGDGVEDHNAQAYAAVRLLDECIGLAETLLAIESLVATGTAALRGTGDGRRGSLLGRLHRGALSALGGDRTARITADRVAEVCTLLLDLAKSATDSLPRLSGDRQAR